MNFYSNFSFAITSQFSWKEETQGRTPICRSQRHFLYKYADFQRKMSFIGAGRIDFA
jgi:hypothetical protein